MALLAVNDPAVEPSGKVELWLYDTGGPLTDAVTPAILAVELSKTIAIKSPLLTVIGLFKATE
jgi:hypothetical protein